MRKGIIYTAMLLCTSLSLLITSCPVYAASSNKQVDIGQAYSVAFFYKGQYHRISGLEELVPIKCSDGKSVQVRRTALENFLKEIPPEKWPEIHFDPADIAACHYNVYANSLQMDDCFKQLLNQNKENTGWKDDDFINGKISKPEDVKCDVIPNIFTYIINMYFG